MPASFEAPEAGNEGSHNEKEENAQRLEYQSVVDKYVAVQDLISAAKRNGLLSEEGITYLDGVGRDIGQLDYTAQTIDKWERQARALIAEGTADKAHSLEIDRQLQRVSDINSVLNKLPYNEMKRSNVVALGKKADEIQRSLRLIKWQLEYQRSRDNVPKAQRIGFMELKDAERELDALYETALTLQLDAEGMRERREPSR